MAYLRSPGKHKKFYSIRFIDTNGNTREKSLNTTDTRIANELLLSFTEELAKLNMIKACGIPLKKINPKENILVTDFIDEYLKYCKLKNELNSYKASFFGLQKYVSNMENKSILLKDVDKKHIENYRNIIKQSGLSPVTVNRYMKDLKAMINKAIEWEYIEKNPFHLRMEQLKVPERFPLITSEQLIELFEEISNTTFLNITSSTFHHLILMYLNTACRRAEILDLKLKHISETQITIFQKKQKRSKLIPINKTITQIINEELKGRELEENAYFFIDKNNERIKNSFITKKFEKVMKNCSFHIRLHDLRHIAISKLFESGYDINTVKSISGHSKLDVLLNIYSHVTNQQKQNALNSLDEFQNILSENATKKTEIIDFKKLQKKGI